MATIIYYGTPAHGHINPSLFFVERLVLHGYRVIYYAINEFKEKIEATGAQFLEYKIDASMLDVKTVTTTDFAAELLRNYKQFLSLTPIINKKLMAEVRDHKPDLIIHDNVASWGRYIAKILNIPAISFNTFVAIDKMFDKSYWAYAKAFADVFFRQSYLIPSTIIQRLRLKNFSKTGIISMTMNKEKFNIMSFNRKLQPGGEQFGDNYFFLGPSGLARKNSFEDDLQELPQNLIYASLGTMSQDKKFIYGLFNSLKNSDFTILFTGNADIDAKDIPSNFIVKRYVNQIKVLQKAKIFISTGGMNGINEAIKYNVPSLIYPTNGEKKMNAQMLKKLGLGDIVYDFNDIKKQIDNLIAKREDWDYELCKNVSQIHIDELISKIDAYIKNENRYESVGYR
ncbi:MAG: hypothetical protein LBQ18_06265 [Campylobacteraceae bacterium]|nr:hypothetical protein [Campylobacteraceae bacterium]